MIDQGPSAEDIERFNRDHGYCPKCGEEIWDQAEFCPACGEHLAGDVSSRPPIEREFRARWFILIAIIILIFFLFRIL